MNGRYIKKTRLILLRHAATAGNIEKRYVGTSDEDLLTDQIEKIKQLSASFRAEFLNFKNIIYVIENFYLILQIIFFYKK